MNASPLQHDPRFRDRLAEIPRAVRSAREKFQTTTTVDDPAKPGVMRATPYVQPIEATMKARSWMHATHYVRTVVTSTVGPGGYGKTTLALFEAITMAVAGIKVWYLSGEDQREEIDRRIMAHCKHHGITQEQIAGKLFVDDKASFPFVVGKNGRNGVEFEEEWLAAFEGAITADEIDVVILDPFVSFHKAAEGDNGAIDQVVKRLAAIAFRCNCCIEISHHMRKMQYGQTELTVDDTRGGSAIINAVRSSRVINRMSEREADLARVPYDQRSTYLRIDSGKRNMAPPEGATWFHLLSVHLANGDNVQAIERWTFPRAFDGMTESDVGWVQDLLKERPRRASNQSPDWLGHYLGGRFGRDTTDRAGAMWANKIIGQWLRNKVFKKEPMRDPTTRKPNVPFYVHNEWVPPEDEGGTVLPFPRKPALTNATAEEGTDDDTTSD